MLSPLLCVCVRVSATFPDASFGSWNLQFDGSDVWALEDAAWTLIHPEKLLNAARSC